MATKNNMQTRGFWLQPMAILQGVLCSFFFLIVLSIILAVVVYFSSWQPTAKLLSALAHLAIFAGSLCAGRRCKQKSWLHGIVAGILTFVILSFMGYGEVMVVSWLWWKRLARLALFSMFGGIVGGLFKAL
ncbi:MAG: TIGR04086 family membrane protein [Firmicutes bacterium]|nr:TIGR04086 family membrane protein [Bacillota bacterium]